MMTAFLILKALKHNYSFRLLEDVTCDSCYAPVEVKNNSYERWRACLSLSPVLDGNLVRCTRCQCLGKVDIDEDGAFVTWQDDVCAKCYRSTYEKLERVTRIVMARLAGRGESS